MMEEQGLGIAEQPPRERRALRPLTAPPEWHPELPDLLGLMPDEVTVLIEGMGYPAYRARQLLQWLHGHALTDPRLITVLPAELRKRLGSETFIACPEVAARQADAVDGTVKYLFRLADGETVETVLMRYRFGYSLCVSSQVGCRMGCRFCASTIGGLRRNLRASEMVAQVLAVQRDLLGGKVSAPPPEPGEQPPEEDQAAGPRFDRISRIVVMGMGEPLENLEAVVRFARIVHLPEGCGIGWRHITVSTSGLVPAIDQLREEGLPITLAISLHAPNDELRDRLMPINRRYPLAQLMPVCRRYQEATGRRLTFEYVMIGGTNDLHEHALELGRMLRGMICHVNLIPLNPVKERPELKPSAPEAMEAFRSVLRGQGIPATVRRQLGTSIDAACGQLRRRVGAGVR